jgi:ABC-type glycerol-3-phosphate transport system permease component
MFRAKEYNSAGKRVFMKVTKKNQAKRYTRSKVGNFFYILFLVAFGAFSVLPLVYCIATSFKPLDELLIFPPRFLVSRPTAENYLALPGLLSNLRVPLSRYIFNSLFVSVVCKKRHKYLLQADCNSLKQRK